MSSEGSIEEPATAGSVLAAPGTGSDSNDESSATTMQEGSDEPVGTETLSDGSVEARDLLWVPIALAALILGAVLLVAVRRRSKRERDPEPPAPHPTVEDMAVITPLVAADVQAADGEWTRDMLTLDPPGAIDGIVAVSDRLVGFGQSASSNGDAAQAAVWESKNGTSWRSVAMLGPGIARLAVPWRDGLLVAAVHGLDERIATTCWWVDSAGRASERAGGEEPLQGVVEGGTATDDLAVVWGRGSRGPRIWVAERWGDVEGVGSSGCRRPRCQLGRQLRGVRAPGELAAFRGLLNGWHFVGRVEGGQPRCVRRSANGRRGVLRRAVRCSGNGHHARCSRNMDDRRRTTVVSNRPAIGWERAYCEPGCGGRSAAGVGRGSQRQPEDRRRVGVARCRFLAIHCDSRALHQLISERHGSSQWLDRCERNTGRGTRRCPTRVRSGDLATPSARERRAAGATVGNPACN